MADAASSLPSGSAYFGLRRLNDDGLYRIINGHSVWIQGLDGLEAPLEPDAQYTDRWFGAELSEILTIEGLVAYLQARP